MLCNLFLLKKRMTRGIFSIKNLFEQVKMDDAGLIACKVGGCTYIHTEQFIYYHFTVLSVTFTSCEKTVLYTASRSWAQATKYSQKWNCATSLPISAFMYLWAIYIFPRSFRLSCCIAFADLSWESIKRPQIHKCRNRQGTRPRRFISGNIYFEFSVQCISSVDVNSLSSISDICYMGFLCVDTLKQRRGAAGMQVYL